MMALKEILSPCQLLGCHKGFKLKDNYDIMTTHIAGDYRFEFCCRYTKVPKYKVLGLLYIYKLFVEMINASYRLCTLFSITKKKGIDYNV